MSGGIRFKTGAIPMEMTTYYIRNFPILPSAINWVITNNPGNWNPYHGINHLFTVFQFVANTISFIKTEKKQELLLAALFHDYSHIGKAGDDTKNVQYASERCANFIDNYTSANRSYPIDREFTLRLIEITRFPYIIDDSELNTEELLLRDADLAYLYSPICIPMCLGGLRAELGVDYDAFLDSQAGFINSVKPRIPQVAELWSIQKPYRLEEIECLKREPKISAD